MSFNFKQAAQGALVSSPLMVGREKLTTDDVIGKVFTVVGFDFADKRDKKTKQLVVDSNGVVEQYTIIVFKENNCYYCAGKVFTKVAKVWAAEFGGNTEAASMELAAQGGVQVTFNRGTTADGNPVVVVDIID